MFGICSSSTAAKGEIGCRRGCSVTSSSQIEVYPVPFEDRRNEWDEIALDRFRFERRITQFEQIFCKLF